MLIPPNICTPEASIRLGAERRPASTTGVCVSKLANFRGILANQHLLSCCIYVLVSLGTIFFPASRRSPKPLRCTRDVLWMVVWCDSQCTLQRKLGVEEWSECGTGIRSSSSFCQSAGGEGGQSMAVRVRLKDMSAYGTFVLSYSIKDRTQWCGKPTTPRNRTLLIHPWCAYLQSNPPIQTTIEMLYCTYDVACTGW